MRVLFVLENLRVGGAQRHALALAAGLAPRFDCDILSLSAKTAEPIEGPPNVRVRHLGLRPLRPGSWVAIARAIGDSRPDLIVTVNPVASAAVAAARCVGGPRPPRAAILHSTSLGGAGATLRMLAFVPVARRCDALVYVSEVQRRYWTQRGLGARSVRVIHNGVATECYAVATSAEKAAAKAWFGWDARDRVFGVAAAMRPEKNLVQLVDALAALRAGGLSARLLIIGDGPERRRVEAHARALNVLDSLAVTGLQADVRPFLAALDVGALPSIAVETLSLFALEAMASGVPMVMSQIGGAAEIVTDGVDGRLFPAGDTPALVAALTECLDPAIQARLSAAALATARTRFDQAPMLAAYADLFEHLIRHGAAA